LSLEILMGRSKLLSENNVLGIWTGVERGAIWQERDRFDGVYSFFGYGITLIGMVGLTVVSLKSGKENT
jgi:hypothetical protein